MVVVPLVVPTVTGPPTTVEPTPVPSLPPPPVTLLVAVPLPDPVVLTAELEVPEPAVTTPAPPVVAAPPVVLVPELAPGFGSTAPPHAASKIARKIEARSTREKRMVKPPFAKIQQ
jgi:hypothetical protein